MNQQISEEFNEKFGPLNVAPNARLLPGGVILNAVQYTYAHSPEVKAFFDQKIQEVVDELEAKKLLMQGRGGADSACHKCGFNNDGRNCACDYNRGIEISQEILKAML